MKRKFFDLYSFFLRGILSLSLLAVSVFAFVPIDDLRAQKKTTSGYFEPFETENKIGLEPY